MNSTFVSNRILLACAFQVPPAEAVPVRLGADVALPVMGGARIETEQKRARVLRTQKLRYAAHVREPDL